MKIVILEHDIKWWVESAKVKELDDASMEHIEESIKQGYTSGSLNVTFGKNMNKESVGWWEIVDWKDIALWFYNETPGAKKRFDENW